MWFDLPVSQLRSVAHSHNRMKFGMTILRKLYCLVYLMLFCHCAHAETPEASIFRSLPNDMVAVDIYGVQMTFTRQDLPGVQMALMHSCSKGVFVYLDEALKSPTADRCIQDQLQSTLLGKNVDTVIRIDPRYDFTDQNQEHHGLFLGKYLRLDIPKFDAGAIAIAIAPQGDKFRTYIRFLEPLPFNCYRYVSQDVCFTAIISKDERIILSLQWYKKDYDRNKWRGLRTLLFSIADIIFSQKYKGTFQ